MEWFNGNRAQLLNFNDPEAFSKTNGGLEALPATTSKRIVIPKIGVNMKIVDNESTQPPQ